MTESPLPMPDSRVLQSEGVSRTISADALVPLRDDMLRFAQLQLRNFEIAEDLVQEAIELALRHAASFAGKSSLKTWVFAILRNQIIDHLRRSRHTVNVSSLIEDGDEWQGDMDIFFNEKGRWRDDRRPTAWPGPEESLQNRQFWAIFEACLDHLPANSGRVFMLREFLGFETDEICSQLEISTSNCHVLLHRARSKLRACMQSGWGRPGADTC
jgi:RNA polymerase sigma-70 factor, ECF subfamily